MVSLGWQEKVTEGWLAATLPWWAPLWLLGSVVRRCRVLAARAGIVALLLVGSAQAQGWGEGWGWAGKRAALRLRFDTPGCYPSGSAIGGVVVTVARAGTKECTGVGTCQANEACVDSTGLTHDSGETISVPSPLVGYAGPFTVVATVSPATWAHTATQVHVGTGTSAANAWALYSVNTGGVRFLAVDGSTANRYVSKNQPSVGEHRLVGYHPQTGSPPALNLTVDGVGSGTLTGTGGLIADHLSTVYLGSSLGGASPLIGSIREVLICKGASPSRCY